MAQLPGMTGQVYWGDPSQPLPNWRDHPRDEADKEDEDDKPLSADERAHLVGVLGFDPDEMDDGDESKGDTSETSTTESLAEKSSTILSAAIDSIFGEGGVYP